MQALRALAGVMLLWAGAADAEPDREIVVVGALEQPSRWREAETSVAVLLSDAPEAALKQQALAIERLHFLLAAVHERLDERADLVKPRITLVGDTAQFDRMALVARRIQPGPYAAAFVPADYHDPREDGTVVALSRHDGKALLSRGVSLAGLMPDLVRATAPADQSVPGAPPNQMVMQSATAMQFATPGSGPAFANEQSITIPAGSRLLAAYARHYLLTNVPTALPRWYVDGFAELFSTVQAGGSERQPYLDFGRAPEGYGQVMARFRPLHVREILSGTYLQDSKAQARWTPHHAWSFTHMLWFVPERRAQLRLYLGRLGAGQPMADALAAFGDLDQLQKDWLAYDNRRIPYERIHYPPERIAEPLLRPLSRGDAAFVNGRLELGSRVDLPIEPAHRARAVADRDRWLAGLRQTAARYPQNRPAQRLLAEAECRSAEAARCIAAADRALAIDPADPDALSWKAWGQVQQASSLAPAQQAQALRAARALAARANRTDPDNPVPLLAWYRSFAVPGQPMADLAVEGLMKVASINPSAPGPRLMLGDALAAMEADAAAVRVLRPLAHGPYQSPESIRAGELLETLKSP